MRILLVDDVAPMREWLAELIRSLPGVTGVRTASNGWEARIDLSRHRPDIALIDEIIPGESSDAISQEFQNAGVRVIKVSAIWRDQPVRGAIRKPMDGTPAEVGRFKADLSQLLT